MNNIEIKDLSYCKGHKLILTRSMIDYLEVEYDGETCLLESNNKLGSTSLQVPHLLQTPCIFHLLSLLSNTISPQSHHLLSVGARPSNRPLELADLAFFRFLALVLIKSIF